MFCAGRNPRQFRSLMFSNTRVTLLWAVPPALTGCLWLVTLSKGVARPFCFVLERAFFTITPTQYQSRLRLQELFSQIFSAHSERFPGCSPSGRCRRWRRHNRRAKVQPRRLRSARVRCSSAHTLCQGCGVRFWQLLPRLIQARHPAAPQSHPRHQDAPKALPECGTRAVASFDESPGMPTWWNAATPARCFTLSRRGVFHPRKGETPDRADFGQNGLAIFVLSF
jgi:hypothetical protein